MRRNLALGGVTRTGTRGVSLLARLALVAVLAVGFWIGALWIADYLIRLRSTGF